MRAVGSCGDCESSTATWSECSTPRARKALARRSEARLSSQKVHFSASPSPPPLKRYTLGSYATRESSLPHFNARRFLIPRIGGDPLFPEDVLPDLLIGRLGYLCGVLDVAWDCEIRHPMPAILVEFRWIQLLSLLQYDAKLDLVLCPHTMFGRDGNRSRLLNRWVRVHHALDGKRRDVLSAAPDDVFYAIPKAEIAFFVHLTRVSGMEPEVTPSFYGFRRNVIVFLHHDPRSLRAHYDLAHLTRGQRLIRFGVHNSHVEPLQSSASRTQTQRLLQASIRNDAYFGHAIALQTPDPKSPLEIFGDIARCRQGDHRAKQIVSVVLAYGLTMYKVAHYS